MYMCMERYTYARVAAIDGKAVGLIFGRIGGGEEHPWIAERIASLTAQAESDPRDRKNMDTWPAYLSDIDAANRAAGVPEGRFDAEVELFVVSARMRGTGIGRRLYGDLTDYFRGNGVRTYCLHTDSECDFSFYERRGMVRVAETGVSVPGKEDVRMLVYGYLGDGD